MQYSAAKKIDEDRSLKPSERILLKIAKYGFNMDQLVPVLKTRGNQLIVSCAGSGKTTSLTFKTIYDITSGYATRLIDINNTKVRCPDKIKVCTFLKSGADELERSMVTWCRRLNVADTTKSISFSTLHAEFKRTLNALGMETNLISESENTSLLKEVVGGYALRNAHNMPLTSQDINDLSSALAYTRNRLDGQRYDKDIYEELGIGETFVDAILRDWKAARQKIGKVDFEDLQEILYEECYKRNNEEVIQFIKDRYNFLYIDEFQDTSQIQYELIKIYGANCKQVLAIGDDDQTIYSWRGSCNDIIVQKFSEDFSPKKNELSVNFRCPSNILESVKPSIQLNTKRFDKSLRSFKDGGEVFFGKYYNYTRMLEALGDLVYQDVADNLKVAVLCRVNSDGLMPALIFDKLSSFEFSISGDGMTLDSYAGRGVVGICKLFTERASGSVRQALSFLTWDRNSINSLMKICKTNKTSIWEIPREDLSYSCPDIADRVLIWRQWRETVGDVKALSMVLQDFRTKVFYKDSQFNDVMKSALRSIESLLSYFNYETVDDFVEELEDINDRLKARRGVKNAAVEIATVHEYKGKESDSVYVWNDSEDVFPHRECNLGNIDELEEERRVHYIACTRAKKKLSLLSLANKEGMFIHEMNLSEATQLSSNLKGELRKSYEEDGNLQKFEQLFCSDNKEDYASAETEDKSTYTSNSYEDSGLHSFESRDSEVDPLANEFWEEDPLWE